MNGNDLIQRKINRMRMVLIKSLIFPARHPNQWQKPANRIMIKLKEKKLNGNRLIIQYPFIRIAKSWAERIYDIIRNYTYTV